jgi:hypothetical protein
MVQGAEGMASGLLEDVKAQEEGVGCRVHSLFYDEPNSPQILYERTFNLKISGKEVYCTIFKYH